MVTNLLPSFSFDFLMLAPVIRDQRGLFNERVTGPGKSEVHPRLTVNLEL